MRQFKKRFIAPPQIKTTICGGAIILDKIRDFSYFFEKEYYGPHGL